jgi:hypothetical protein
MSHVSCRPRHPTRLATSATDRPTDVQTLSIQSFSTTQAKLDVSKLTLVGRLGAEPVERKVRTGLTGMQ